MPHALSVDKENNVWVADIRLHQIFKFSHGGNLLMKLGVADIDNSGHIYVAETGGRRVRKFKKTTAK
jgi:peptidylamidoglycolate lyase